MRINDYSLENEMEINIVPSQKNKLGYFTHLLKVVCTYLTLVFVNSVRTVACGLLSVVNLF